MATPSERIVARENELIKKWLETHKPEYRPSREEIRQFLLANGVRIRSAAVFDKNLEDLWNTYDKTTNEPNIEKEYETEIKHWINDNSPKKGSYLDVSSVIDEIEAKNGKKISRVDIFNKIFSKLVKEYYDEQSANQRKAHPNALDNEQAQKMDEVRRLLLYDLDEQDKKILKRELLKLRGK